MNKRTATIAIVVIIVIAVAAYFAQYAGGGQDQVAVRATVADFSAQMQKVSLLAPDASSTIAAYYTPYVDRALIIQWQKNPKIAPGRLTSSPWPDHIEITDLRTQGAGYLVSGAVILKTSADTTDTHSDFIPVYLQLIKEDGAWRIVAYQEVATTTPTK